MSEERERYHVDEKPIPLPPLERAQQGAQQTALITFEQGAERHGMTARQVSDRYRRYEEWLRRRGEPLPASEFRMLETETGGKHTRFVDIDALDKAIARSRTSAQQTQRKPVQSGAKNIDKTAQQSAPERKDLSALVDALERAQERELERAEVVAEQRVQIAVLERDLKSAHEQHEALKAEIKDKDAAHASEIARIAEAAKEREQAAQQRAEADHAEIERLRAELAKRKPWWRFGAD